MSTVSEIQNEFEGWGGILSQLSQLASNRESDIESLAAFAQSLRSFTGGNGYIEPDILCDQLLAFIAKMHLQNPSNAAILGPSLSDTCDEMRLRMASIAFGAIRAGLQGKNLQNQQSNKSIESPNVGAVTITPGRTAYARVDGATIIVLPTIESEREEEAALAGLLDVSEKSGLNTNWVIDFSAVRKLSRGFCGVLVGYAHSLKAGNGKLSVCWLNKEAEIDCPMESLIRTLHLIPCAGYWFSDSITENPAEHEK